jgi:hypothetical protein
MAVTAAAQSGGDAPVQLTTQQDHQRTMALLGISEIRRGADGRNPDAPNAANYDESKANGGQLHQVRGSIEVG